jgi:hypothetical protein
MDRAERESLLFEICARCGAQPVQHIGKVLVVYRKAPPAESAAASSAAAGGKRPATRSGRRVSRSASRRPESAPRPSRRRTSR